MHVCFFFGMYIIILNYEIEDWFIYYVFVFFFVSLIKFFFSFFFVGCYLFIPLFVCWGWGDVQNITKNKKKKKLHTIFQQAMFIL